MQSPNFYLSSTEGYGLETPRACRLLRRVHTTGREDFALVEISPSIMGQRYGLGEKDISEILVGARYVGDSLFPVGRWPMDVYVARLLDTDRLSEQIGPEDYELIGLGELYQSPDDIDPKQTH